MNSNQKQFNAFLESICTVSGHTDILSALQEGFKVYCEGMSHGQWNDDGYIGDDDTAMEMDMPGIDATDNSEPTEWLVHPGAPARDKMFVNNNMDAYRTIWNDMDEACGITEEDGERQGKLRCVPNFFTDRYIDYIASSFGITADDVKRLANIFCASIPYINNREMACYGINKYGPYKYVDRFAAKV